VVEAPAGQALEGGLGGLPVAAAAGRLPAGLGAQQLVDLVPLATGYRRPLPAVASAMGVLAAASCFGCPRVPSAASAASRVAAAAGRPSRATLPQRCFAGPEWSRP
jgi:hypothetical protein